MHILFVTCINHLFHSAVGTSTLYFEQINVIYPIDGNGKYDQYLES